MKIKILQELLKDSGYYNGAVDGDFGAKTRSAVRAYYEFPDEWPDSRLQVGCIQVICIRNGFEVGIIDGFWGRKTQSGYEKLLKLLGKEAGEINVKQEVNTNKSYNSWPSSSYNDIVKFYGKIGENQTSLTLPYTMVSAWDTSAKLSRLTCHAKVKSSFEEILKETLDHYGIDAIKELELDKFGGCLNVRKMRGGTSWSHHSWGVVMDLDPDRNRLQWRKDKAFLARPEYKPFWKIVESKGMTGMGPELGYDWMHLGGIKY